jgi:hypothetical protein
MTKGVFRTRFEAAARHVSRVVVRRTELLVPIAPARERGERFDQRSAAGGPWSRGS